MPFLAARRPLLEREVRARVVTVCPFERVDRLAHALVGAVLRHLDHQTDVKIARRATLRVRDPAPAESQALPSLAALRNLQLHPSLGGGDLDRGAEHRFPDRHRHLHDEIPPFALEVGVRAHLHDEVEVSRPRPQGPLCPTSKPKPPYPSAPGRKEKPCPLSLQRCYSRARPRSKPGWSPACPNSS